MQSHLRFAPSVLARLGEELVSDPDQGIVELVKNAFDADATFCSVSLQAVDSRGGTVIVSDDGDGMTGDQITDGWLVIGKSAKDKKHLSRLRRRPVGDKGLGRIAALRLGAAATLETRSREKPDYVRSVRFAWPTFDSAASIEDVPIDIVTRSPTTSDSPHGTTITIEALTKPMGRRDVQRLARSLVLLADPFDSTSTFRPILRAPGFEDLERLVKAAYFGFARYKVDAAVDAGGRARATVRDGNNRVIWKADHRRLAKSTYSCPSARFECWLFVLDAKEFIHVPVTITEVRQWLSQVGGVHVYARGMRVRPYGDAGHDWLDLNLRRARSPEHRPSTNTIVGRMLVDDPGSVLLEKTDRIGFVENDSFMSLRQFGIDVMDWVAAERLRQAERQKEDERVAAEKAAEAADAKLDSAIESLPPTEKEAIEDAVENARRAQQALDEQRRGQVEMYRSLATVGTTVAVFAHDSHRPLGHIRTRLDLAEAELASASPAFAARERLDNHLEKIRKAVEVIQGFTAMPLALLQREKRVPRVLNLNGTVSALVSVFRGLDSTNGDVIEFDEIREEFSVFGSESTIESILVNFLTNALNFVNAPGSVRTPRIRVSIEGSDDWVTVRVSDNGPGIRGDLEEIWLPGFSTTEMGTGLGLTIVKDAAHAIGGEAGAAAVGGLGGADFWVTLPTWKPE